MSEGFALLAHEIAAERDRLQEECDAQRIQYEAKLAAALHRAQIAEERLIQSFRLQQEQAATLEALRESHGRQIHDVVRDVNDKSSKFYTSTDRLFLDANLLSKTWQQNTIQDLREWMEMVRLSVTRLTPAAK